MTDCNRLKPLTQLQIDLPENISKGPGMLISMFLYDFIHLSGLSTFKQMPETDNSYKTINFGTKNRPSYKPVKTTVYHGVNVDEGFDTELYCPCCGAKLYCNGSQPVVLNHLPEGQTIRKFWLIEDVTAVQEKNAATITLMSRNIRRTDL